MVNRLVVGLVGSLALLLAVSHASSIRASAGIRLWDKNTAQMKLFANHRAAMAAGVEVTHHPSLEECHQNCERAKGCGDKGVCQCGCCGGSASDGADGCFCYKCGPLGAPIHAFSMHPENSMEEPTTCAGSKMMCGESAFSQADKDAKEMKKQAMLKKIAAAQERTRLAEESTKKIARDEEDAKKREKLLQERVKKMAAYAAGGEERSKRKVLEAEKVAADDDLKVKSCETKNKANEVLIESQKLEIQKRMDENTQLEAELKSLKDRFAKEVGTGEALKSRVNAAERKTAALENEVEKAKNLSGKQ